jgi:membrane-associated phospholipid phosphatase
MQETSQGPSYHWFSECKRRFMHQWYYKASGTALFMVIFFYSYFAILRSPIFPVTTMATTMVDDWIIFWPSAFHIYASLWVYTALVPALQPNFLRLVGYGCGIGLLCLSGLLVFLFFPTVVPFTASDWPTAPALSLLRTIDLAGNACPSLHVAAAIFTGMSLHRLLRNLGCPVWLKTTNWVWCVVIIYSTMAIKQHVMWDVLAGVLLAVIFGLLYPKFEDHLATTSY